MHRKSPLRSKPFCEFVFCGVSKTCTVDITHGWNMHALCEQRFGTRKHLERMHFNLILVFGRFFLFYVPEVHSFWLRTCMKRMTPQKAIFPFSKIHLKWIFSSLYNVLIFRFACSHWYTSNKKNVQSHIIRHKTCKVASKCLIFAFFWLCRSLLKI